MQRGRLYLHSGRYAEAQTDMNHVLQFHKDSADAHYVLAQIANARSNAPVQRQELEEALKIDPQLVAEFIWPRGWARQPGCASGANTR